MHSALKGKKNTRNCTASHSSSTQFIKQFVGITKYSYKHQET